MNYREFKHKAKELDCEIKETDEKIKLYYWETGSVFAVSKLFEKGVELPNCIATDSQYNILDLVLEFSKVPLSEREDEEDNLDLIIHRLEVIRTNSEDAISWGETMSWADVMNWISKEIEKNRDLKNELEDIIKELEEYKNTHSIGKLKRII